MAFGTERVLIQCFGKKSDHGWNVLYTSNDKEKILNVDKLKQKHFGENNQNNDTDNLPNRRQLRDIGTSGGKQTDKREHCVHTGVGFILSGSQNRKQEQTESNIVFLVYVELSELCDSHEETRVEKGQRR
ncbi:hypothetical protein MG293_017758 [Ovis ammon polii]|uniref:Uncharacterized protein n=1 Tax=Ovis ammon polii TaxID=230172 RepID=A0AAD4TR92_OVIAM|nr:hypothetical protein MG293_017758 [Ovis ammon polii]